MAQQQQQPLQAGDVSMAHPTNQSPMHPHLQNQQDGTPNRSSPFRFSPGESPATAASSASNSVVGGPMQIDQSHQRNPPSTPSQAMPTGTSQYTHQAMQMMPIQQQQQQQQATSSPSVQQGSQHSQQSAGEMPPLQQSQPTHLSFHTPDMSGMTASMDTTSDMLTNAVAQLEAQAMNNSNYGLGMGDIVMEGTQPSSQQSQQMSQAQSMANAANIKDMVSQPVYLDSRKSSTTSVVMMQSQSMGVSAAMGMQQSQQMPTSDLSSEVHEKLSLIDSIVHDANLARAQLLQGQDSAADDRLNEIGNRLIVSSYASPGVAASQSAGNVPNVSMFSDGGSVPPSMAPSPAPRMSAGHSRAPSPPTFSGATLAPAFELQRSTSVKRALPESPVMAAVTSSTNKHIRLGDSMDLSVPPHQIAGPPSAPPMESTTSPLAPPPLMHASHSFPNVHQLPSQHTASMASTLPLTPVPGGSGFSQVPTAATFAPALSMPATAVHMPHVPSPLSAMPITSRPPSPSQQYYQTAQNPQAIVMPTWEDMAAFNQSRTFATEPFHSEPADATMFMGIQQPMTISRRGSIVDGRLIAGRPGPSVLADHKSVSASAVPTMTSIVNHARRPPSVNNDDSGVIEEYGDSDSGGEDGSPKPQMKRRRSSTDGHGGSSNTSGKLVLPQVLVSDEIRENLDRILFEFLNRVCSDLEYTDSKGELLHQALMPKKMARLDESPDFRPFKFRIQAFTNAFHEELQSRGVMDETLSAKKVKSYLWTQNLISRFNDDGKKSKSKGNHIWNVDAKKLPDGSWVFREFRRKIAGVPPQNAFIGTPYIWTPRVWDPQASTSGLKVEFRSPEGSLPRWLRWEDAVLTGMPEEGDLGGQITAIASFYDAGDNRHEVSTTFTVTVMSAPSSQDQTAGQSTVPTSVAPSRLPSGSGDSLGHMPSAAVMHPGAYADPNVAYPQFETTMQLDAALQHHLQGHGNAPPQQGSGDYGMLPIAASSVPVLNMHGYVPHTAPPGQSYFNNQG